MAAVQHRFGESVFGQQPLDVLSVAFTIPPGKTLVPFAQTALAVKDQGDGQFVDA